VDSVAIEAARLLGTDRPWRRATDNDLAVEAEYRLRAARECLALDPPSPELCAFHDASLGGIRREIERRLVNRSTRSGSKGMTRQDVERIRDAAPCQEVAQWLGIDMRPAGRERWVGLCWHGERTPSLSVHRLYFHCFGCGIGGDVFELVLLVLGLQRVSVAGGRLPGTGEDYTFRDAVRVLADWAGLPDPTGPPKPPLVRGVTY
jgi:hypothetical protein